MRVRQDCEVWCWGQATAASPERAPCGTGRWEEVFWEQNSQTKCPSSHLDTPAHSNILESLRVVQGPTHYDHGKVHVVFVPYS